MANNKISPDSDQFKDELENQFKAVKKSTYELEIAHISEVLLKSAEP